MTEFEIRKIKLGSVLDCPVLDDVYVVIDINKQLFGPVAVMLGSSGQTTNFCLTEEYDMFFLMSMSFICE